MENKIQRCLRRWRKKPARVAPRANLSADDPYGVLDLPAYPDPDRINATYRDLRKRYAYDESAKRKVITAYRELCRRQGAAVLDN